MAYLKVGTIGSRSMEFFRLWVLTNPIRKADWPRRPPLLAEALGVRPEGHGTCRRTLMPSRSW